ncbi:hypothetical protein T484DRAFT_1857495 [Baffinella frigidus]|nr:hypothetical protein T484DRAFT_1857495 [Cryptophyta sp. CCMP2293]
MSTTSFRSYAPSDNNPLPPMDPPAYLPTSPPNSPTSPPYSPTSPPHSPVPKGCPPSMTPGRLLGTWGQEIAEHGIATYTMHPGSRRFQPDELIAPGNVLGSWEEEIEKTGMTAYTIHPGSRRFRSDEPAVSQPASQPASPTMSPARIAAYARCHPHHLEPWTTTAVHIDTELGEICNATVPAPPNPAGPLPWPKGIAYCTAATTTTTGPFPMHHAWPAGVIIPPEYYAANTGAAATTTTTGPFPMHHAWPAGVIIPPEYYAANTGTDETFETVLDTSADAGSVQHRV